MGWCKMDHQDFHWFAAQNYMYGSCLQVSQIYTPANQYYCTTSLCEPVWTVANRLVLRTLRLIFAVTACLTAL
jgi:hypothetical protein